MSALERCQRLTVNVSPRNSFDLTMTNDDDKFSLAVVEPTNFAHNTPSAAQDFLRTVMLAHLIAPHLPQTIETNFPVTSKKFLDELYHHYGYRPPRIKKVNQPTALVYASPSPTESVRIPNASAHSGGLDSVFRLVSFLARGESVLGVHLRNLNSKNNLAEATASQDQCRRWHIPYEQVRLRNGSHNTNFNTMRTRDFLLALITAISAAPHQTNRVVIEGGMSADYQDTHFSEYAPAWEMFNHLIKEVGLDLTVDGVDPGDIETVAEILKLEARLNLKILPLVQNCFSGPFQGPTIRAKWERQAPVLAKSSPQHWCGSCHKCRRMTLGRIYYHDPRLRHLPKTEAVYFVADTYDWLKKYPHNRGLISPSFLKHLSSLQNQL